MKQIEFFMDFYNELSVPGLILFWMIIVLFFFLFFSLIAVLFKNQELRKIILKIQQDKNDNFNQKSISVKKDSLKSLDNEEKDVVEEIKYEEIKKEEKKKKNDDKLEDTNIYQKNVLKEHGTKDQTSPISIGKTNKDVMKIEEQKLEPIDIENQKELDDLYYENINDGNSTFVEEISKQVDDELEDTPIDLTDFENSQEEDAIISYEELLRNAKMAETREERYNIDVEDDDDFLKELKSFRSNL